jgi:poly(3-hydroxybutyrate) depolymerase
MADQQPSNGGKHRAEATDQKAQTERILARLREMNGTQGTRREEPDEESGTDEQAAG